MQAAGANLGAPDPATFPKAFSFCNAVADDTLKDLCYGSFGKEFIPLAAGHDIRSVDQFSDAQYSEAISWCMTGTNARIATDCVNMALDSVFWGGENDPQASFRFCALVPDAKMRNACYAKLAVGIGLDEQGDKRTALCGQFPTDTLRQECENAKTGSNQDL
jgi:hypothetical protein